MDRSPYKEFALIAALMIGGYAGYHLGWLAYCWGLSVFVAKEGSQLGVLGPFVIIFFYIAGILVGGAIVLIAVIIQQGGFASREWPFHRYYVLLAVLSLTVVYQIAVYSALGYDFPQLKTPWQISQKASHEDARAYEYHAITRQAPETVPKKRTLMPTSATPRLKAAVINNMSERPQLSPCPAENIVIRDTYFLGTEGIRSHEEWTIDRCGQEATYPVYVLADRAEIVYDDQGGVIVLMTEAGEDRSGKERGP